ncbi:MAG: helix-turn-helix transcriptional regulator [Proteobacteria bacterium]|nr:helix-turn-helix transcriptional regulator [Pseudomonadota bacterium]
MDRFLCSITRLNPAPELIKPIVTRFREFVSAQKSKSDLLSMISGSDKGIDKPLSVLSPKLTIPLSPREKDIVFLMTKGMTAEQTALELKISKRTVERHFENLRRKLKCKSKGQIINRLVEHGFTMPDLVTE